MKNKRRFFYMVICLLILCGCVGCGNGEKANQFFSDELQVLDKEPEYEQPEDIKKVGVYVDVTPSMKGFLGMQTESYKKIVRETRYMICLDEISKIIAGSFDKETVTCYRVDTPLWKTRENVLNRAKEKSYYDYVIYNNDSDYEKIDLIEEDGDEYKSWCLTNTLLNCMEDDFSVIITDFYENDRAASEVINALKANMANPERRTIGVIGLNSEFAGRIYDLYPDGRGIDYGIVDGTVTEEDICYRQFYVIVLGNPEEVQEFCQCLQAGMNTDDIKYKVFYENERYGVDYTGFNQCHTRSVDGDRLFPDGKVRINENDSLDVYDYDNANSDEKDITISYRVYSASLKKELEKGISGMPELPDIQQREMIEVPFHETGETIWSWNGEHYIETEENATELFAVERLYYSPEEELLYVKFKVFGNKLPIAKLKLGCQLCFENEGSEEDEWIEQWNLENGEIDCRKTRNLKEYCEAIREEMPVRNDVLLEFVFYINHD